MLYVLVAIIGVAIGVATGGKLSNLLEFKIKRAWLFVAAFAVMTIARLIGIKYQEISYYTNVIHILLFVVIVIGLWNNRYYIGIWFLGIGCFLNSLVMVLNHGKMPVSASAAAKAGISPELIGVDIRHTVFFSGKEIKLSFLADVINLPGVLGYGMRIVSIGDLVVVLGVLLLSFQMVRNDKNNINETDKQRVEI